MIQQLGINAPVPINGWIFSEQWANSHPSLIRNFLKASRDAATIMLNSDAEWQRLTLIMTPQDRKALNQIKRGYRSTILNHITDNSIQSAEQLFRIFAEFDDNDLMGNIKSLNTDTFWQE